MLAILPEEILRLVDTTLWKARGIIKTFEQALHLPVGYSIKVSKANDESRLTEWEFDCPTVLEVFWESVKEDILDIVTFMQQLGMAEEFHSEDIKLLSKAVTKDFLLHLE